MPFNETAVYMEKHSKHETSGGSSSRESKLSSPTIQCMGKPIDNPLIKYQGCKWEQIFDFDKVLKQIRNAERYYLRGKHDHNAQSGSSKSHTGCSFPRREQPQVQRLSSNDMHFYGMVPKQPFDVVVCDKCLGIYTKMGFNNHMKMHHQQAWNLISSKASSSKDSGHNVTLAGSDNFQDNANPMTEQAPVTITPTTSTASSSSRHKSSKSSNNSNSGGGGGSGSSGGSSRSRSKSKHHHHHHQQQPQSHQRSSSASAVISSTSSHASQTSSSNTEVPISSTSSKISKKASSGLSSAESKINVSNSVPKEIKQSDIQSIPPFSSTSSNSSISVPTTSKADLSGAQENLYPSTSPAIKEKPKASKRKSKNIVTPLSLPPPENNESSNSSVEYSAAIAAAAASTSTPSKSTSKRSKPKGGKDLKQLMEPQLTELDKAISSITGCQTEVLNEASNSNDNDCDRSMLNTPTANSATALSFSTEEASVSMPTQIPIVAPSRPQQQQQPCYGAIQMLPENPNNNIHQQQVQQQQQQQRNSNAEENDNSILTLEDMLDSKFIHAILNTDESEIHFDESELDKAAQQQQQPAFMQPTVSKRMRYDEQVVGAGIGNVENVVQQQNLPGKYAAFQQQQQQQPQQAFHVSNLEDMKMYTTAIDAQQYLSAQQHQPQQQQQPQQLQQQQEQHQITTIDPMQLQQLLYQQQHQQNLNAYATVGTGLDDVTAALEQQHYNESDVIMCSAEQLHKEGKINAADYATLAALSGNSNTYGNVSNNICVVNGIAAAAQFQVYNIPSLTDDDVPESSDVLDNKLNDVIMPQNHYVLPAENNDEEQLIYEITSNNHVAVISQQRQQQMIAEFLNQAGYDSVDNVNVNLNSGTVVADDTPATDIKHSISLDVDANMNELMDFDFSRLDTVKSCSSSSTSSSADSKGAVKNERNNKFISPNNLADDLFLNVFLYTGLPRPLAVNSFGLCKLPQGVATTFRKNLHATRKANNSPITLNGNGGAAVNTRFSSNASNPKPTTSQNYFTALGAGTNAGNIVNEFSIGSITITNQTHQIPSNNSITAQQQQMAQKQSLIIQTASGEYGSSPHVNGLIPSSSATSPPVSNVNARSSRPKSAGSINSSSNQSKQKYGSSSSSTLVLPQNQAKSIIVNANNVTTTNSDQTKFIKRSMICKMNLPTRNYMNFSAKQLSDILLHPSKDKYMQLLGTRDLDREATVGGGLSFEQQRLNNVRQFYERRKRLLNTTTSTTPGYNQQRYLNSHQSQTTANGLKQKFLRQRLLRTLSDCGIDSIKSNSNSANNSSNNDILRVS